MVFREDKVQEGVPSAEAFVAGVFFDEGFGGGAEAGDLGTEDRGRGGGCVHHPHVVKEIYFLLFFFVIKFPLNSTDALL